MRLDSRQLNRQMGPGRLWAAQPIGLCTGDPAVHMRSRRQPQHVKKLRRKFAQVCRSNSMPFAEPDVQDTGEVGPHREGTWPIPGVVHHPSGEPSAILALAPK